MKIFEKGERTKNISEEWENNLILPLYKKGERSNCDNCLAICLSSVAKKTEIKIIEQKLRNYIGHELEETYGAFRKNRQIIDNIFMLRNIIEKRLETGGILISVFINLRRAFETIQRKMTGNYLEQLGTPKKLIEIINSIYANLRARSQVNRENLKEFNIRKIIMH